MTSLTDTRAMPESRQIGRGTYLIGLGDQQLIVKVRKSPSLIAAAVTRLLGYGGGFRNECCFYQGVVQCGPGLDVPTPLLVTDSVIVLERLSAFEGCDRDRWVNIERSVFDTLAAIRKDLDPGRVPNLGAGFLFSLLRKPVPRAFLDCRVLLGMPSALLRVLWFLVRSTRHVELGQPKVIHGDLGDNNVLVDVAGKIHLIDWEDAVFEKRWIHVDVTDLAWDLETGGIRGSLIGCLMDRIGRDAGLHIRFGLVRRALHLQTLARPTAAVKRQALEFLSETLLDAREFDLWLASVAGHPIPKEST